MSGGVLFRSMGPDEPEDGHTLRTATAAERRARYGERDDGGREIGELYRGLRHAQSIGDREMEQFFADQIAKYGDVPQPPREERGAKLLWDDVLAATYPEGKP